LGCSTCLRLNANNWRVSEAARDPILALTFISWENGVSHLHTREWYIVSDVSGVNIGPAEAVNDCPGPKCVDNQTTISLSGRSDEIDAFFKANQALVAQWNPLTAARNFVQIEIEQYGAEVGSPIEDGLPLA
jgi:hypothetical protein